MPVRWLEAAKTLPQSKASELARNAIAEIVKIERASSASTFVLINSMARVLKPTASWLERLAVGFSVRAKWAAAAPAIAYSRASPRDIKGPHLAKKSLAQSTLGC